MPCAAVIDVIYRLWPRPTYCRRRKNREGKARERDGRRFSCFKWNFLLERKRGNIYSCGDDGVGGGKEISSLLPRYERLAQSSTRKTFSEKKLLPSAHGIILVDKKKRRRRALMQHRHAIKLDSFPFFRGRRYIDDDDERLVMKVGRRSSHR